LANSVYHSTRDAAARLSIGASTLKKLRINGGGPAFHRIGRRVVYSSDILDEWAKRATFESTSEYRRGATAPRISPPVYIGTRDPEVATEVHKCDAEMSSEPSHG
jgi:hypothetical protein